MSIKAIEGRRSIRKYKSIPVQIETINKIISAGIRAPSGKNKQPWRFIIVGGKEKENMLEAFQDGIDREKTVMHYYLEAEPELQMLKTH
jgi:nitroreductase